MHQTARPGCDESQTQPSVAAEHMMENQTMKKAIFAVLTVLGISLATGALAPAANAYTYLFAPAQNAGRQLTTTTPAADRGRQANGGGDDRDISDDSGSPGRRRRRLRLGGHSTSMNRRSRNRSDVGAVINKPRQKISGRRRGSGSCQIHWSSAGSVAWKVRCGSRMISRMVSLALLFRPSTTPLESCFLARK